MSANKGRSEKISGAITSPMVGDAAVVSISAGVPDGRLMRMAKVLPIFLR